MFCSHVYWDGVKTFFFLLEKTSPKTSHETNISGQINTKKQKRKKWRLCSGSSTKTSESNIRNFTNIIIKQFVFHSHDKVWQINVTTVWHTILGWPCPLIWYWLLSSVSWAITWTRRNTSHTKIHLMLSTGTTAEGKGAYSAYFPTPSEYRFCIFDCLKGKK